MARADNSKNLIKGGLNPEQASKMGKMSVEARRKKAAIRKTAKEFAQAFLDSEITDKKSGKKINVKDAMIQTVAKGALSGDLSCTKYLLELVGEAPVQRTEITGKDGKDLMPQKLMTAKEMKELFIQLESE